ncbi:uncharacterized protein [Procambarus clarkii]|uniref:uncharacterized protein n=1 Tax=Procambarus clarkii TaxID=6728 RepID=UPI00374410D6
MECSGNQDDGVQTTLTSPFELDRTRLGELQREEFPELIREAEGGRAGPETATHFYLEERMLMRQWRPVRMEADMEALGVKHQVVLPTQCRGAVLELEHSVDPAGHLGVTKTLSRIREHFYWPGMDADVGIPREIQTDCGSVFRSRWFRQTIANWGITQIRSSPYRPQSQRAIERFHSTLKTMLRVFCVEHGEEWDEAVYPALFAIRDAVVESLGFSLFQVVYGHEVRSLLLMLKEQLTSGVAMKSVNEYVYKFREQLGSAKKFAA